MRSRAWIAAVAVACGAAALASAVAAGVRPPKPRAAWRRLEAGLELGEFVSPRPSDRGDSVVRALRIEPSRFELRLLNASANAGGGPLALRAWRGPPARGPP